MRLGNGGMISISGQVGNAEEEDDDDAEGAGTRLFLAPEVRSCLACRADVTANLILVFYVSYFSPPRLFCTSP